MFPLMFGSCTLFTKTVVKPQPYVLYASDAQGIAFTAITIKHPDVDGDGVVTPIEREQYINYLVTELTLKIRQMASYEESIEKRNVRRLEAQQAYDAAIAKYEEEID